ncbi:sugar phosphate isomerase/epimerase [Microbulbifer sp. YPW1]|uniref:sugar phosphate isomerase/epimerase family protein n=1 Tax=Microbulbifer sp. YPW1 TaxID=2745199 RepID=UPI001597961D|nr:sugar phosphate isomerase/epimerase [Microbulbifer sp. YPW1]QKX17181.1 sugar phosphate isomerase/epimerase [Microbulbifer sp. YPW1]
MNRRDFLNLSVAAITSSMLPSALAGSGTANRSLVPVSGVQLYTVRTLMEKDVAETLKALAAIGYKQVEFAGYYGVKPGEIRRVLNGEGLEAPSAHLQLSQLRENFAESLETVAEIGHRYAVLPWLAEEERTPDNYRRLADELNLWAEQFRTVGIQLAYHNHDFEFHVTDGFLPYHHLLEATDPQLVSFEMDLFWVHKAGRDPLEYFSNYPGRFPLWHIKDMDSAGNMVSVGAGLIDFPEIFKAAKAAGYQFGYVEHDNPENPLQSVSASLAAVRNWNGL